MENRRVPAPAVALRFTAGYAFHPPSGVKSKKQKFHGYITKYQLRILPSTAIKFNIS
ncbi:MAG: hypothetical protein LBE12_17640 [Planctomycetaceae bacterium]|nr:hypothetical protein [Planctomycetaceae bacterium]